MNVGGNINVQWRKCLSRTSAKLEFLVKVVAVCMYMKTCYLRRFFCCRTACVEQPATSLVAFRH